MQLLTVMLAFTFVASAFAQEQMSVQVKESAVRETPQTLGKVAAVISYGQRVRILEKSGQYWVKIQTASQPPVTGWVRTSELTSKKLNLSTSTAPPRVGHATAEEIAMAGKGLDMEVENRHKSTNNTRGYQLLEKIDAGQSYNVSLQEAETFKRQGSNLPGASS